MPPHSLVAVRMALQEASASLAASVRGARLAPGRLRVPKEGEVISQTFLLERAADLGPIFKVWLPHKLTTCLVGHTLSRRFLTEHGSKVRAGTPDLSPLFPHGILRALEGEVHRTYRRRILEAFNATPLEFHEAELRSIMRSGLESFASHPQPVPNDVIRTTMKAMTSAVFLRLVLGVSRSSSRYAQFVSAYDTYARDGPFLVARAHHRPTYGRLRTLVGEAIDEINSDPDASPSLLRHLVREGTVDETIIGNLIQMVEASRYDLHGLWTWILKHLGENPGAMDLARQNATGAPGACPATAAVPRESLRM